MNFCMPTVPHAKTASESELSATAAELLQDYMLTVGTRHTACYPARSALSPVPELMWPLDLHVCPSEGPRP